MSEQRSVQDALKYTLSLCAGPAGFMLVATFLVFVKHPPDRFVYAMQHLGAGIVLSAVATELLPIMLDTPKGQNAKYALSIVIGFSIGVALMLAIANFCGEPEDDDEKEKEDDHNQPHAERRRSSEGDNNTRDASDVETPLPPGTAFAVAAAANKMAHKLPSRRHRSLMQSYRRSLSDISATPLTVSQRRSSSESQASASQLHSAAEPRCGLSLDKSIPWPLVVAVYVDSFMDGFLIGISSVAGSTAGLVMCVALTIEMTFLGMTFSASLSNQPVVTRAIMGALAPGIILVGGTVGAAAASVLLSNHLLQVGLVSFGAAALLYLVTEELLLEAHENDEGHVWYIDSCFFIGFMASILIEKAAGE